MPASWRSRSRRKLGPLSTVMPALDAGIQGMRPAVDTAERQGWIPGSSPGMTMRAAALLFLLCTCLFALPAFAQDLPPRELEAEPPLAAAPDPGAAASAAITALIETQWHAFLTDDGAAAFAAASPQLQAIYQRPTNFMAMVAAEYGAIYRARSLAPGDFVSWNGYLARRVTVTGPQGEPVTALYLLTRLSDGSWRIAGCLLFRPALES
jgi:hypothetical protein